MTLVKNFHPKLLFSSQDEEKYFEEKEKFHPISASRFAAVFGCSPYISKHAYWQVLRGNKKERKYESPASIRGRREEPHSAKFFAELIGAKLNSSGCKPLTKDTRHCASPDRLFEHPITKQKEGLELKNPDTSPIPRQLNDKMIGHVFQCILNMEVFGREYWNLLYYDRRNGNYAWFRIKRNEEFFDNYLLPESQAFLQSVKDNKPPSERQPNGAKKKMIDLIYKNHYIELVRASLEENKI